MSAIHDSCRSLFPPPVDSSLDGLSDPQLASTSLPRNSATVEASVERIWAEQGENLPNVARFFRRVIDELPRGQWSDGAARVFAQLMDPRHVNVEGLPMRKFLAHVSNEKQAWNNVKTGLAQAVAQIDPAAAKWESDAIDQYFGYVRGDPNAVVGFPKLIQETSSRGALSHLDSFLSHRDRPTLAGLTRKTAAWIGAMEANHSLIHAFVDKLPMVYLPQMTEDFVCRLLIFARNPKCWQSCMKFFLTRGLYETDSPDLLEDPEIDRHLMMAQTLQRFWTNPTWAKYFERFFAFMASVGIEEAVPPGLFLRIMQCYLQQPGLNDTGLVENAIRTYLAHMTRGIRVSQIGGNSPFTEILITSNWFGHSGKDEKFWITDFKTAQSPSNIIGRLLSDAFFECIQAFQKRHPGLCMVNCRIWTPGCVSYPFLESFARRITDAEIYWLSDPEIDANVVNKPQFVRNLHDQ